MFEYSLRENEDLRLVNTVRNPVPVSGWLVPNGQEHDVEI